MDSHPERLCIWRTHGLFVGRLPEFGLRRQAAAAICVCLEGEFEISRDEQNWRPCRTALTAPLTDHAIRFHDNVCALIFLDPISPAFNHLLASNGSRGEQGIYVGLAEETYLLDFLSRVSSAAHDAELKSLLDNFLPMAPHAAQPLRVDKRIQKVALSIMTDTQRNIPVEELAATHAMSVSSLEHLFKQQIGIPLRMFRAWFRLKAAVLFVQQGLSLTEAALRAGFFDSAHFTRAFKDTFGLPPSEIFNPRRQLLWYVAPDVLASRAD